MLLRNQSYNNRSILYVTPRSPGDGLPESIIEEEKERIRVEAEEKAAAKAAAEAEAAAAKAAEENAGGEGAAITHGAGENDATADAAAAMEGQKTDAAASGEHEGASAVGTDDSAVGEIVVQEKAKEEAKEEIDPNMRKYGLARDLLVLSPPFLGCNDFGQIVLSARLAEKYEAIECTLDSIVSKCIEEMTPFGLKAEQLLPFEPLSAEEIEQMDETAKAKYEAKVERVESARQAQVDAAAFDRPIATQGGDNGCVFAGAGQNVEDDSQLI